MKYTQKILCSFLIALSFLVGAQEEITEGIIISKQTITSDNAQMQAQFAQMGEMETTTYFKGLKSRSELNNPMAGKVVNITNGETNEVLILMDNMMGKLYTYQKNDSLSNEMKDVKVLAGDETKTILGYECKQYSVIMKQEGVEMEMKMFTTESIPITSDQTAILGDKLKGFPLYIEIIMNQMGSKMVIKTEVINIKKDNVSEDIFDMKPPEGYKEMSGQ